MKLASYADGSRDGHLVIVSRDLTLAHHATGIATRLQQVLDDWGFLAPQLEDLTVQLSHGKLRHAFPFEPQKCLAPLPRGCGWALHLSELIASKLIHVTTAQRRLAEIAAGFPLVAIAEIAAEGPGGSVPDAGATVCRDSVCLPPLADAEALITQLEALAPPRG